MTTPTLFAVGDRVKVTRGSDRGSVGIIARIWGDQIDVALASGTFRYHRRSLVKLPADAAAVERGDRP